MQGFFLKHAWIKLFLQNILIIIKNKNKNSVLPVIKNKYLLQLFIKKNP